MLCRNHFLEWLNVIGDSTDEESSSYVAMLGASPHSGDLLLSLAFSQAMDPSAEEMASIVNAESPL